MKTFPQLALLLVTILPAAQAADIDVNGVRARNLFRAIVGTGASASESNGGSYVAAMNVVCLEDQDKCDLTISTEEADEEFVTAMPRPSRRLITALDAVGAPVNGQKIAFIDCNAGRDLDTGLVSRRARDFSCAIHLHEIP